MSSQYIIKETIRTKYKKYINNFILHQNKKNTIYKLKFVLLLVKSDFFQATPGIQLI